LIHVQGARITDFSIGGLFLEIEKPSAIKRGKTMNIDLSLPTEYDPIRVEDFMAAAYKCLFAAKEAGKDCVVIS
jgi:GGDEF domain-containing protein